MLALFRADATSAIGGGHVMRCLTLADALAAAGWRCTVAATAETRETVPALERGRAAVAALSPAEAGDPEALPRRWPEGCGLLVVDHYGLDAAYETVLRGWARTVLAIDDLADRPHAADFLLDQTLGRRPEAYAAQVSPDCRLLLGPHYALLRPQFATRRAEALARRAAAGPVGRILVSLGLTDPAGMTGRVVAALAALGWPGAVDIVLGRAAAGADAVRAEAGRLHGPVRLLHDVADMADLMTVADLAVGAAGTTSWERCCLGLPTVTVVLAANQRCIADELAAAGAAALVTEATADRLAAALEGLIGDAGRRRSMAARAAAVCDGAGAGRVVAEVALQSGRISPS